MPRAGQLGVTLIELMIVVVIVGILAAIAYPSYQSQVRKSRRAAAQAFLMDVAARQQQRMLDVRSYAATLDDLNVALPSEIDGFYAIDVAAQTAPLRFTLTATPLGAQAQDSGCNPITLLNTGAKSPAACW